MHHKAGVRQSALCALRLLVGSSRCVAGVRMPGREQSPSSPLPIIDMNLKAHSLSQYGGGMPNCANNQESLYSAADPREPMTFGRLKSCRSPIPPAANDESLMTESLATLERRNIFAVSTGPLAHVRAWRAAAPNRKARGLVRQGSTFRWGEGA